mmetsp:Transcript_41032/g.112950  ORF Transcript_41032/g.112950 Transcript_41032/m.112950 type:complete len:239 (+) Transcript_41032:1081-1797(+)
MLALPAAKCHPNHKLRLWEASAGDVHPASRDRYARTARFSLDDGLLRLLQIPELEVGVPLAKGDAAVLGNRGVLEDWRQAAALHWPAEALASHADVRFEPANCELARDAARNVPLRANALESYRPDVVRVDELGVTEHPLLLSVGLTQERRDLRVDATGEQDPSLGRRGEGEDVGLVLHKAVEDRATICVPYDNQTQTVAARYFALAHARQRPNKGLHTGGLLHLHLCLALARRCGPL